MPNTQCDDSMSNRNGCKSVSTDAWHYTCQSYYNAPLLYTPTAHTPCSGNASCDELLVYGTNAATDQKPALCRESFPEAG